MVFIDTSAWIEFFRASGNPAIKSRVAEYITLGNVAYTCPVSFELFLGARDTELADLREGLGFAKRFPVSPVHWDKAAQYGSKLRSQGITLPASDLLVAVVVVESGGSLLTCDAHFQQIKENVLESLELV